jgi:hypothetical protein
MRLVTRHGTRWMTLTALVLATASCGDVVRSSRAPVLLVINVLQGESAPSTTLSSTIASDVITLVTTGGICTTASPCPTFFTDPGSVTLSLAAKDISAAPSTNNQVTITRVHVAYRRADGRAVEGVDVPYAFDGAATGTVPVGASLTLGFVLVRSQAKLESPLVQLQTSGVIITTIADCTFYGTDLVGNAVSVTGSIEVDFGNFGDK